MTYFKNADANTQVLLQETIHFPLLIRARQRFMIALIHTHLSLFKSSYKPDSSTENAAQHRQPQVAFCLLASVVLLCAQRQYRWADGQSLPMYLWATNIVLGIIWI